jgi:hypothetical protein
MFFILGLWLAVSFEQISELNSLPEKRKLEPEILRKMWGWFFSLLASASIFIAYCIFLILLVFKVIG